MTEVVIHNLRPQSEHQFIFLCLKEHIENHGIDRLLQGWAPGCKIVKVDTVTEGAACTVLLAKDFINTENPLMIANCDQWVDIDINAYLAKMDTDNVDGLIMTMWADETKWSYIRFDTKGIPCEVVEKEVVSNEATVGIYNYRCGKYFVDAAESMIAKNLRVNNEFYVAPVYNEMIAKGLTITVFNIGKVLDGMYGLGTPDDLQIFENLALSKQAVAF
jgi:NDP-sugar pyrophosphorylase family protein